MLSFLLFVCRRLLLKRDKRACVCVSERGFAVVAFARRAGGGGGVFLAAPATEFGSARL